MPTKVFRNDEGLRGGPCFSMGSPHNISRTPVVCWSNDNKVSVATSSGTYILVPQCNADDAQKGLSANISFISAEDKSLVFDVGIDKDKLLDPAKGHEELQAGVALDRSLNPDGDFSVSFKGFHVVKWSPKGADNLGRCIAAMLTRDHRLCIYTMSSSQNKLRKVADLSKKYHSLVKKNDFQLAEEKTSQASDKEYEYHLYRNILYSLAAVDISWTPTMFRLQNLLESDTVPAASAFSFLSVSMKDGSIAFWKIMSPCFDKGSCSLAKVEDTGIELPSASLWAQTEDYKGYFIVGYCDGRLLVYGYNVDPVSGDLSLTDQPLDAWKDIDKLAVNQIVWDKENEFVFFSKENFILVIELENTSKPTLKWPARVVHRFDVAVAGLTFREELMIGASAESEIIICRKVENSAEVVFQGRLPVDDKKWSCYGIDMSPNAAFIIYTQSPCYYYDSLRVRDPFKIKIISVLPKEELCERILEERDELPFDLLEDLRYRHRGGMALCETMQKLLSTPEEWQDISLYYHKLIRFLIKMQITCLELNNEEIRRPLLEHDLATVEDIILKHHIIECMNTYNQIVNPSDNEQLIAALMVDWCKRNTKNGDNKVQLSPPTGELCAICSDKILLLSITHGICTNNHSFGRCCRTLLLCQNVPYRKCVNCSSLALTIDLTGSDWLKQILGSKCTFCDGLLL